MEHAHISAVEAVYRLLPVTHVQHLGILSLHQGNDLDLQRVGVLELVHHDGAETLLQLEPHRVVPPQHGKREQQDVVEIHVVFPGVLQPVFLQHGLERLAKLRQSRTNHLVFAGVRGAGLDLCKVGFQQVKALPGEGLHEQCDGRVKAVVREKGTQPFQAVFAVRIVEVARHRALDAQLLHVAAYDLERGIQPRFQGEFPQKPCAKAMDGGNPGEMQPVAQRFEARADLGGIG